MPSLFLSGDGEMRPEVEHQARNTGYLTRHVFWASKIPGR